MQEDFVGTLTAAAEINLRQPVGTEAGVKDAVGVISRDCEILNQAVFGNREASSDDLAVGLKNGRARLIEVVITEVGSRFSGNSESRVNRPISQITCRGEVIEIRRIFCGTNGDELAVRLHENGKDIVVEPVKIGCDLAVCAEGGVGCSIRIVTRKRKVGIRTIVIGEINEVCSRSDNLAVSLQGHGEGVATLSWKTRRHDAAVAKGAIERSIQVIANYFEIAKKGKERKGAVRDHDFAVRLDDQR